MSLASAFLRGYQDQSASPARTERVLAVGRVFLTATGFIAIYLDPTEPSQLAAVAYGILFSYALYSLVVLALVHRAERVGADHALVLHGFDVLWTSGLTLASDGPVSPFFLFFLFVILSAAYRWGFRETVATTVVIVGIFVLEVMVATRGPWRDSWFRDVDLELNRVTLRVSYLLLTGFLLGYLSEQEKRSRSELAAVADVAKPLRVDIGLTKSVEAVADALIRTFDAAAAAVVVQDVHARRTLLWRFDRTGHAGRRATLRSPDERVWLFPDPARVWHTVRSPAGAAARWAVVEPGAWPLRRLRSDFPDALATLQPCQTITATNLSMAGEWTGRIYLFDVATSGTLELLLHFLERLTAPVEAGLTNALLLRRLRSQASAAERARVAREIHDGTIQALFGLDLKIEALRRHGIRDDETRDALAEIQGALQREVTALREVMQALRPIELDSGEQLPDVLASIVERFRRDSGLSARFVADGAPCAIDSGSALELARIVQEALVNARKHSRAQNVIVRLTREVSGHRLVIEDDGEGFEFEGTFELGELDRQRIGPATIKERARIVGADLVVESRRGVGATIQVTVPAHAHGHA
jgi:signal transduction histidine kinase